MAYSCSYYYYDDDIAIIIMWVGVLSTLWVITKFHECFICIIVLSKANYCSTSKVRMELCNWKKELLYSPFFNIITETIKSSMLNYDWWELLSFYMISIIIIVVYCQHINQFAIWYIFYILNQNLWCSLHTRHIYLLIVLCKICTNSTFTIILYTSSCVWGVSNGLEWRVSWEKKILFGWSRFSVFLSKLIFSQSLSNR